MTSDPAFALKKPEPIMFKIIKYLSVISALTLTASCDMGKSSYELEVKADITEFEVYHPPNSHQNTAQNAKT